MQSLLLVLVCHLLFFLALEASSGANELDKVLATNSPVKPNRTEKYTKVKDETYKCIIFERKRETWSGHNKRITREFSNSNISGVDVYTEIENKGSLNKWVFNFTSQVWDYMMRQYGEFGTDSCLLLMIHRDNYTGGNCVYALDPDPRSKFNILDLSSKRQNAWSAWSTHDKDEEMDLITNNLAYFVEFSSHKRFGSLSYDVWRGYKYEHTAWVDIFTYDVYTNLNYSQHAQRYKNKALERSDDTHFPTNVTFWFRDWFLPIYELGGGNTALKEYFKLLKDHLPPVSENLNLGKFVHFWSAAAQLDLKDLAGKAFGWNKIYEEELTHARSYIKFHGFYNVTSEPFEAFSTTPKGNYFGDENRTTSKNDSMTISTSSYNSKATVSPDEKKDDELKSNTVVVSASAGVIVIIVLVSIVCILFYKKKIHTLQTEIRTLTAQEVQEFFDGDPNANISFDDDQALIQSMPFIKDYEIPKDQIILARDKVIGTGQFGYVLHGFVRFSGESELVKVAVKMMRPNVDVVYFKAFLSEVKIMAYLGKHENIVDLMGTCTENIKEREMIIALELCPLGNLHDFLRDNRHLFQGNEGKKQSIGFIQGLQLNYRKSLNPNYPAERELRKITNLDLVKWSKEIANAMIYLKYKKVIHGPRNILLTANRTAKICDFGLSRQVLNYSNYMKTSKTPVPWRWLAIECMQEQKFSTASDVWAYGVLIWEIFSLGETPYGCYTYDLTFANKLISGERLLQPVHASPEIYELMHNCWKINPEERISFQQIHDTLQTLLSKSPDLTFTAGAGTSNSSKCSPSPFLKVEVESTCESHV